MPKHTYRQKFQTTFMQEANITALCMVDDKLWIGTQNALHYMNQDKVCLSELNMPITVISHSPDDKLWIGTESGLFCQNDEKWTSVSEASIRAICHSNSGDLYYTDGQTISGNSDIRSEYDIRDILFAEGQLWLATEYGLVSGDRRWTTENGLLSNDVRSISLDGSGHLWIATASGINIFDKKETWYPLTGENGLPHEDVYRIMHGPSGERWVTTGIGAACYASGKWEYYTGKRWLPSDKVNAIAIGKEGEAWMGTDEGLARIEKRSYTFEEKAEYFEERITSRHKRYGFVSSCDLETPGDVDSFIYDASDNDGLWTSLYVAAECFRYAVTKDEQARKNARESMQAMMGLEEKTSIDGFPARAMVRKDENRVRQSNGEWHDSPDGEWLWKGDTSSDEIDGHAFAYGIYYDLVADEAEKKQLADTFGRIMEYIVDNDFLLIDVDGERTRWGVWSPSYLNGPWKAQQGLNSLEILAYLKTAYHITGNQKFQDAYEYLIQKHHYALNTIDQKIIPPGIVNHSDDELAFLAYYVLLIYEDDPDLRSIYLLSLERQWQHERVEHCPLWNFMYGALSGNNCDVEEAILTLEQIPMDLITWTVQNSHRADIQIDESDDRFEHRQSLIALPADERRIMKWNGNACQLDGGNGGRSEDDGGFYLIAYWLGRYHGFVV